MQLPPTDGIYMWEYRLRPDYKKCRTRSVIGQKSLNGYGGMHVHDVAIANTTEWMRELVQYLHTIIQ